MQEGDPISAYKLLNDDVLNAYLSGKMYCSDEAPLLQNGRKININ